MKNHSSSFQIESIGPSSSLLTEVLLLHAASKSNLGAFPKGAFEEAAQQKRILVAIAPDKSLAGYLVYRVAKHRAAVAHLTTDKRFKGQGAARSLMDALKLETKHLAGISLKCRRDYDIGDMWKGFGFTVRQTREGRGRDRALLDCWWFDHGHEDLFSFAAGQDDDSAALLVAIDANVFYDLTCEDRPQGEDTKVLEADWIEDSIVLCITEEMYNEIHRATDEKKKAKARGAADGFLLLKTAEETVTRLETELKPVFNYPILDRDLSDMRQVAHAIAAKVPFLVTRDNFMLSGSDTIFEKYGLRIFQPTDLINHLDSLRRVPEYRPSGLEGSRWSRRLVTKDDVKQIVTEFKHPHKERANDFERTVRHYLASPKKWTSSLIFDNERTLVVYVVQSNDDPDHLKVVLARHSAHPLAPTILRHIFHSLNGEPGRVEKRVISISDPEASGLTKSALADVGFLADDDVWWKLSAVGIFIRPELVEQIRNSKLTDSLKDKLTKTSWFHDTTDIEKTRSELEHAFSPVKIVSPGTPCFIISIWPEWAAHFFDIPAGGQMLTDLKDELHLGIEGVYYCDAKNKHLRGPGRILWYVSKGPKNNGPMTIKACSHLEEVVIGKPKQLFADFRHLGVFGFKHVLKVAKGKLENNVIACRFKRTERFVREISLKEIEGLKIAQPINPRRITDAQFATIYKLGMNLNQNE